MIDRVTARLLAALAVAVLCVAPAEARRSSAVPKPKSDQECMARAMYFESARTEEDGMLAVGTVVANRLESGRYGDTVCEVVSAYLQFAPGVLTRRMAEPKPRELAFRVAAVVLAGARHPAAEDAKFFHTANVPFRKGDKRYVLVSGGNAFYKWNRTREKDARDANAESLNDAFAKAGADETVGERVVQAALAPADAAPTQAAAAAPEPKPADPAPVAAATAATPPSGPATLFLAAAPPLALPVLAGPAAPATGATLALAFAAGEAPAKTLESQAALAVVAALKPRSSPRVIELATPVQAAMGPVWSIFARPSMRSGPLKALQAVREAWTAFR